MSVKTEGAVEAAKMDMEEIRKIIQETLNEEFAILKQQILECVEAAATKAFASLKASFERGDVTMETAPQKADSLPEKASVFTLNSTKPDIFIPQNCSPLAQLKNLKTYFEVHKIDSDLDKLKVAEYGLKSESINPRDFATFCEFQAAFLENNLPKQTADSMFGEMYNSFTETLADFASRKIAQARKFFPEMLFSQFRTKFASQVPAKVAARIVRVAPASSVQLIQMLGEVHRINVNRRERKRRRQEKAAQNKFPWQVEQQQFAADRRFRPLRPPQFVPNRGAPYARPHRTAKTSANISPAEIEMRRMQINFQENLTFCNFPLAPAEGGETVGLGAKADAAAPPQSDTGPKKFG